MVSKETRIVDKSAFNKGGIVHPPGGGKSLSIIGGTITSKTKGEDSGGAWSLLELTVPSHFGGPPPHWHKVTQEGFYVLEGTITFQIGEQTVKSPPGGYVFIPTGVIHTYANAEDEPAKFLAFLSPGGFEKYYDELAELIQHESSWPPANTSKVWALMAKYDSFPPPSQS